MFSFTSPTTIPFSFTIGHVLWKNPFSSFSWNFKRENPTKNDDVATSIDLMQNPKLITTFGARRLSICCVIGLLNEIAEIEELLLITIKPSNAPKIDFN